MTGHTRTQEDRPMRTGNSEDKMLKGIIGHSDRTLY